MKTLILSVAFLALSLTSTGQLQNSALDDLKFYADVIANAGDSKHKERANREFTIIFDSWIHSDAFNLNDLLDIQWISVKTPLDSAFTIISWQLDTSESDYAYFGYLLHKDNIYALTNTKDIEDLTYDVLSTDDWAGALYYNIHMVEKDGQKLYVLFGYNGFKKYEHRKIADVLFFENDKPVFGKEMFKKQELGERGVIQNRLILDYSSDSNASLNFNPSLNMIVMDHLIPRFGRIPGQGPTMLPDGSYVGYSWDGQYFNYVDKIYNQVSETPPMPKPVIGNSNTTIFGKEKKRKSKKN